MSEEKSEESKSEEEEKEGYDSIMSHYHRRLSTVLAEKEGVLKRLRELEEDEQRLLKVIERRKRKL